MAVLDAYGNPVPSTDARYLAVHDLSGGFLGGDIWLPNPGYQAPAPLSTSSPASPQALTSPNRGSTSAPAPTMTALQMSFDTIGQTIIRTLGDNRVPLRLIWISDVVLATTNLQISAFAASGSTTLSFASIPSWITTGATVAALGIPVGTTISSMTGTSVTLSAATVADIPAGAVIQFAATVGTGTPVPTMSFAAAICAPIDPLELSNIQDIFAGGGNVLGLSGITPPPTLSPTDQAQLIAALTSLQVFPGTESQLPAAIIVADQGADKVNAERGIRYITIQHWPLSIPFSSISVGTIRENPLPPPTPPPPSGGGGGGPNNIIAVEFAAGSS